MAPQSDNEPAHVVVQVYRGAPIDKFLGQDTLAVMAAPDRVESFIIEDRPGRQEEGFVVCTILAEGPLLNDEQVSRLTECILAPQAHYDGNPIFRRAPPVSNFAFRVRRGDGVLDVLVDLHNPGWEFHCGGEHRWNWNWVGKELVGLAKELFPQFASSGSRAVWQKGAIEALREKVRAANDT